MFRILFPLFFLLSLVGCGSSSGDVTYVAFGASDATGIGAFPPSEGYVFELKDIVEANCMSDLGLFNLGIPGAEISEFRSIELPAAVSLSPDIVTIWAGGNDLVDGDSASTFETDLAAILEELTNETSALIFIGDLPDLSLLPRFQEDPSPAVTPERIAEFNEAIERQAAEYGAMLVTLSDVALDNVLVSIDGFHPSNEGHRLIAERFAIPVASALCG